MSYLNPGHIVLLHLLHLVLHHGVQLILELEGLQMVHVPWEGVKVDKWRIYDKQKRKRGTM